MDRDSSDSISSTCDDSASDDETPSVTPKWAKWAYDTEKPETFPGTIKRLEVIKSGPNQFGYCAACFVPFSSAQSKGNHQKAKHLGRGASKDLPRSRTMVCMVNEIKARDKGADIKGELLKLVDRESKLHELITGVDDVKYFAAPPGVNFLPPDSSGH